MKLEVKIEIRSVVKKIANQTTNGNTHNFTVLVQGLKGNKIENFVKQVVFHLPFDPANSEQVKKKPPYLISGSWHASFRLPIDVFLHTPQTHNKVRYSYYVHLPDKPVENAVNVKTLTFLNAPQDFKERLLLGGAEVVNQGPSKTSEALVTPVKTEPIEGIENKTQASKRESKVREKDVAIKAANNESPKNLPNTCPQSAEISEQNDSVVIQGVFSFDELMKENEILQKENEALCNKFNQQEGVIASYAKKLPVLQDELSAVNEEFALLQKQTDANDAQISSLKSAIQALMSEIDQYNSTYKVQREKKTTSLALGK